MPFVAYSFHSRQTSSRRSLVGLANCLSDAFATGAENTNPAAKAAAFFFSIRALSIDIDKSDDTITVFNQEKNNNGIDSCNETRKILVKVHPSSLLLFHPSSPLLTFLCRS